MSLLASCVLLAAVMACLLLAGYCLAARLTNATAPVRLSVALLAGTGLLLWSVAAIGYFQTLSGVWAWLCLWPVPVTLIDQRALRACVQDTGAFLRHRLGGPAAALTLALLAVLLWPLLSRPGLIYYDGSANHDAFFWITAAEHLQHHTYLEYPRQDFAHPYLNTTDSIIGWKANWGRMGAEGLLALTASIARTEPIRVYLVGTAALLLPWLAALYLTLRTFLLRSLSRTSTVAAVGLSSGFIFFYANANLPNLLGAVMAAAIVVSTQRALSAGPDRWVWMGLLALGGHGLLCVYPEMLPFVGLPAVLLLARFIFAGPRASCWQPVTAVLLAAVAALALNPASAFRAIHGFLVSFFVARADQHWANLFGRLTPIEYFPGLATLSSWAVYYLGSIVAALLTLPLLAGCYLAWKRAHDRTGALIIVSGSGALLLYTVLTQFHYGWQKTVQFGGVFWVAFLPVAVIDAFAHPVSRTPAVRWLHRAGLAAMLFLFGFATYVGCEELYKWSDRKEITREWTDLGAFARRELAGHPVVVEGATFAMAHFYSMWAPCFLRDNDLVFAARGDQNGGYLTGRVQHEGNVALPGNAVLLVGREWADAFEPNSQRLVVSDTFAVLANSNRVLHTRGFEPENGPPRQTRGQMSLTVLPHAPCHFELVVEPRKPGIVGETEWVVTRRVGGAPDFRTRVTGSPPWCITVPLAPGETNEIEATAVPAAPPQRVPPFAIRSARLVPERP